MSTVNLAELVMAVEWRYPQSIPQMNALLSQLDIEFIAADKELAVVAGRTRARFPLNFGDCFCYALAIREDDEILTLDAEFSKTDARLVTL